MTSLFYQKKIIKINIAGVGGGFSINLSVHCYTYMYMLSHVINKSRFNTVGAFCDPAGGAII